MDIKCPSSNMHKEMKLANIAYLSKNDQLKFILKNKKDYNYAKRIVREYKPICHIFFQPVWGFDPNNIVKWMLSDDLNVKLGLQIHKILGIK